MKLSIFILPFVLTTTAHGGGRHAPIPVSSPAPVASTQPSPISSHKPGWHFTPVTGYANEIQRVKDSETTIEKVKASTCFSDNFTKRALIQTNGMTNPQVIDFIRKSSGTAPVVYYYSNNGTVGYRQPPSPTIYVNRKFHNSYGVCAEGSGNGHEMLHVLGFEHDFNRTARRPYSVPYSWNAMFDECCPKVMGGVK